MWNEFDGRTVLGVPGKVYVDMWTQALGKWVDVSVLAGMAGGYLIIAYLALHFLHKEKR